MDKKEQQKRIKEAREIIRRNGGKVAKKTFLGSPLWVIEMPKMPGLKVWAAYDCLVNYGPRCIGMKP